MVRKDAHEPLLVRWVGSLYGGAIAGNDPADPRARLVALRKMAAAWAPTAAVWRHVLEREDDASVARFAADAWRALGGAEEAAAVVRWAAWLLAHGRGADAAGVIGAAPKSAAVEAAWAEVLRTAAGDE
jgi:hypothetical protein